MIPIKGIYDGRAIAATEPLPLDKQYKMIITFIEEITGEESSDESFRNFGHVDSGLDFWNNESEDIYQDFLTKNNSLS